jgi:TatD DNase family protein
MKPFLIDSHCHLHFTAYEADRDAVLLRMRKKNVWAITVGTNLATSRSGIAFAERHDGVFATVGYHPEHLTSSYVDEHEPHDDEPFSIDTFAPLPSSSKKVVAIGETGLDFFRIDDALEIEDAAQTQEFAFREHLQLAHKTGLPLVIHCRDAFNRLATIIQDEQNQGNRVEGVIHCFTGSWEDAKPLIDLGMHIGFTGIVTYKPKKDTDPDRSLLRVVERIPIDRLLIETDAPWLSPEPNRGKQNEPAFVEFVAKKVAELRHMEFESVAEQSTDNAMKLFKLEFHGGRAG